MSISKFTGKYDEAERVLSRVAGNWGGNPAPIAAAVGYLLGVVETLTNRIDELERRVKFFDEMFKEDE